MHYVYVLVSHRDRRFYVGSTCDLKRRFEEHAHGQVESTRHRRPFTLIAYEAYRLKSEATRREMFLKTSDGRKDLRRRLYESIGELIGEDVGE